MCDKNEGGNAYEYPDVLLHHHGCNQHVHLLKSGDLPSKSWQRNAGLSPYYNTIYGDNVDVWYVDKGGSNQKLCHEDGHIQGGPLSLTLSAITIKPLVEELQRLVTEGIIETVEAARNDPTIPADRSIFHFFSHDYGLMMPHSVSRSRRSSLFSGCWETGSDLWLQFQQENSSTSRRMALIHKNSDFPIFSHHSTLPCKLIPMTSLTLMASNFSASQWVIRNMCDKKWSQHWPIWQKLHSNS